MQLRDYFTSQKQFSLDPSRKMAIYETITQRKNAPVSIFARMSFYTKVALYTFIGMIFLASIYVPYFSSLLKTSDGILTSNGGAGTVQADYIAQIIETKGDIAIYNNGQKVESKLFRAGDRLVLPAGAEIVFHVTTIAQAKVTGPAEFSIEKTDQGYTIQLVSGKYAEVESLQDNTPGTTSDESVGFRSSRVSITPKGSSNMHFTYTEQGTDATIDNQGATELVVAKVENTGDQEILAGNSLAHVGDTGDVVLNDIVTSGAVLSGVRMPPSQVAKALINGAQDDGQKKMLAADQHENIKAILSPEFLAADIQHVTETYLKGSARDYEVAYGNLYNKIEQIYTIMGIKVPEQYAGRTNVSLKNMIGAIENLLDQMDSHFYTAQSHQSRLKKLLGWLYALREKTFGSEKDTLLSGTDLLGTLNLGDYTDLLGK